MQVSASFLGSKNIPSFLEELNETTVNYIHVDVMDGKYVPAKTISFKEVKNIYKYTSKRLDVHLMVENPINYIKDYALLNAEYITV
ncbi:MAG: ribulose-phosphate 3-epimerase, partial [Bacilli bacterium]